MDDERLSDDDETARIYRREGARYFYKGLSEQLLMELVHLLQDKERVRRIYHQCANKAANDQTGLVAKLVPEDWHTNAKYSPAPKDAPVMLADGIEEAKKLFSEFVDSSTFDELFP